MNKLISNQISIMFIFSLTGIIIGLIFDFFRIRRRVFKAIDFITYLEDILFWIISGLILIFTIMEFTDGIIRIYMILGMFIGLLIYFLFVSKALIKIFICFFNFLFKIVSNLFCIFKGKKKTE